MSLFDLIVCITSSLPKNVSQMHFLVSYTKQTISTDAKVHLMPSKTNTNLFVIYHMATTIPYIKLQRN
jgi:hypothetical protein